MGSVEAGLAAVREAVASAARAAGREPGSVRLIAVSKTYAAAAVRPALTAGQRDFGENRVQEAQAKWPTLKAAFADARLHLIGPLQSNKASDAVALFDAIHTLDRDKLAAVLARECAAQRRTPELFVQVNIGAEAQKAGIAPGEAVDFVRRCQTAHGLAIAGLMCIPPVEDEPTPHFAALGRLAAAAGVGRLSMGMSGDFAAAIATGATDVRVGSAIFGARPGGAGINHASG